MARCKSPSTKKKLKMGLVVNNEYSPYITTSEFNSSGTTSVIVDWKTGRGIHCLSQAEAMWYYILRWDDDNIEIYEQFLRDNQLLFDIAHEYGIREPRPKGYGLTTDFLVLRSDNKYCAYSVKSNKDKLSLRDKELLFIEKKYWLSIGYEFQILFKDDLNKILYNNIRNIVEFYNMYDPFDKVELIKHLLARKYIITDLNHKLLEIKDFLKIYEGLYD